MIVEAGNLHSPTDWPPEIGGYEVTRVLVPTQSALAGAPGNRPVVLKRLDADCLERAGSRPKLHSAIRDRLARIRELAHSRVANLHGAEHDQGWVYLVWQFIEGSTLEDWAAERDVSPHDLLLAARELILTVESLHARGIVHGALHGRNVIVDAMGKLQLTHLSPLLYSDPQHDMASVAEMFRTISQSRGETDSPLDLLAAEAERTDGTLRSMGSRASSLIEFRREEARDAIERQADQWRRRRSRSAAMGLGLFAIFLSYVIGHYVARLTPHPLVPPEAPAAME